MFQNYYFYSQLHTYLLEIRCKFYFKPGPKPWGHSGAVSVNFVVPRRKVCLKHKPY